MTHPFTKKSHVKNIVWLAVVIGLLILSVYEFWTTLYAKPHPGSFFAITTFVLFLLTTRVTGRILAIRRGLPKS